MTRPCLSDYDLVTRMQETVAGLTGDCDIRPGNFERAGSPSERAGIENSWNRDSRRYLGTVRSHIADRMVLQDQLHSTIFHGQLLLVEPRAESEAHQLETRFSQLSRIGPHRSLRPQMIVPSPSNLDQ